MVDKSVFFWYFKIFSIVLIFVCDVFDSQKLFTQFRQTADTTTTSFTDDTSFMYILGRLCKFYATASFALQSVFCRIFLRRTQTHPRLSLSTPVWWQSENSWGIPHFYYITVGYVFGQILPIFFAKFRRNTSQKTRLYILTLPYWINHSQVHITAKFFWIKWIL